MEDIEDYDDKILLLINTIESYFKASKRTVTNSPFHHYITMIERGRQDWNSKSNKSIHKGDERKLRIL